MIAPDSKKNAAAMIIASMKPATEHAPELPEVDDHEMVASEIMDAIAAKDALALKEALKSFVQMCQDEESSEPVESPAEESAE